MPLDLTALNQAIADDTAQVAQTTTVEAGATTMITGFSALTDAVTAALTKDGAANQGSIDAAAAAIAAVTKQYTASAAPLAAALVINTPVAPAA